MDETPQHGDWRLAISNLHRESALAIAGLDKAITASIHEVDQRMTASIHEVDNRISGIETTVSGVRATVRLQSALLVALLGGMVTLLWKAFVQ